MVGQESAWQFTGPGDDTIRLSGVVYPEFRGGFGQIDDLRKMAAQGVQLRLTTFWANGPFKALRNRKARSEKTVKPRSRNSR